MNITAHIEGAASTRAEKFDWEENDQLGVFVCNGTIDQPYLGNSDRYTNVLFKHNGKGFLPKMFIWMRIQRKFLPISLTRNPVQSVLLFQSNPLLKRIIFTAIAKHLLQLRKKSRDRDAACPLTGSL